MVLGLFMGVADDWWVWLMTGGCGLPDEPHAVQHSILLLHALLGGLQQANHILRLLVVHLTPRGTLLERGGERGGERGRREGGRE